MMRYILAIGLLGVLAWVEARAVAAQDSTYLCLTEMRTGFNVDEDTGRWASADFQAEDRFIVRPLKEGDPLFQVVGAGAWATFEFGNEVPTRICTGFEWEPLGEVVERDFLLCNPVTGQLRFNRKTLRFTATYTAGWDDQRADAVQEGGDTPFIAIGSCIPL